MRSGHGEQGLFSWNHALELAQMFTYTISAQTTTILFSPLECLAILVSILSSHLGYDEFVSDETMNREVAIDSFVPGGSSEQKYAIMKLIQIMSDPDSNIFNLLSEEERTQAWNIIVSVVPAVDIGCHFQVLEEIGRCEKKSDWYQLPENRLPFIKLILKALDVSDLARSFDYADLFAEEIADLFFERADMSKIYGMVFTGGPKSKETIDTEKSFVPFMTYVCIPLFNRVAVIFPVLGLTVEQMRHNVRVWQNRREAAVQTSLPSPKPTK
jgi:hypothetical protein